MDFDAGASVDFDGHNVFAAANPRRVELNHGTIRIVLDGSHYNHFKWFDEMTDAVLLTHNLGKYCWPIKCNEAEVGGNGVCGACWE